MLELLFVFLEAFLEIFFEAAFEFAAEFFGALIWRGLATIFAHRSSKTLSQRGWTERPRRIIPVRTAGMSLQGPFADRF